MSFINGATFYAPEQDVLTFGVARLQGIASGLSPQTILWNDTTKAMRKLAEGDELRLIQAGTNAGAGSLRGIVQFFCKS